MRLQTKCEQRSSHVIHVQCIVMLESAWMNAVTFQHLDGCAHFAAVLFDHGLDDLVLRLSLT